MGLSEQSLLDAAAAAKRATESKPDVKPLEGIRVLDLTVALAGPYCSLLLAGLGAEVIKVETPGVGDIARNNSPYVGPNGFHFDRKEEGDISLSMLSRSRNKKSITLDLKTEAGKALFLDLAAKSDVVLENLSEGAAERLGVGYEAVCAVNASIVYGSISGLGEPSLYPGLKAMDIIVQALGGLMDVTGPTDGPPTRVGVPIGDLLAPLFCTSGILAAIIQRQRTGLGQHVKVSMLDAIASLVAIEHFDVFAKQGTPARTGNHLNRLAPFGLYQTADGYVSMAVVHDAHARGLFEAMGKPEMIDDPRFSSRPVRAVNADVMNQLIEAWTRTVSSQTVFDALFRDRGISCAPLRKLHEVLHDPLLHARGALQAVVHPQLGPIDAVATGLPIQFSGARTGFDRPAPDLGENNDEIYADLLGLSESDLERLRADRVI